MIINFLALKKNLFFESGIISGIFLILYSVLRIISEFFRAPDVHIGYIYNYFSMGVILSIFTLFLGLVITFIIKKNELNH